MSKHLGDYDASAVIYDKFTTYRPSTGASFTLGGTPALSVYKDNSTTQSTTGVTLTADFDSVTGLNHYAIDTSADGTFYSAGSFFQIVITTGTVDSVSVTGSVVASFTIRKDSSLKPTVAARTLDVSAGGEAGVDWANVGSPTTAVNLSGTNIDTDQVVASVSGAVGSVTGAVGSVTGAVGSVTGNVGGNVVGSVGSVTGLTAANLDTTISSRASAADLATVAGYLDTEIAAIKAKTDNLPAAPAAVGDIPTAAANADAVWDEALAGHLGVGSTGEALNAAGAAGDPWTTALPGAYGAGSAGFIIGTNINAPIGTVDTVVDAIKAKTDSLAFTVAGQVDANIQYVNDVAVTGDGQTGTEWGPA